MCEAFMCEEPPPKPSPLIQDLSALEACGPLIVIVELSARFFFFTLHTIKATTIKKISTPATLPAIIPIFFFLSLDISLGSSELEDPPLPLPAEILPPPPLPFGDRASSVFPVGTVKASVWVWMTLKKRRERARKEVMGIAKDGDFRTGSLLIDYSIIVEQHRLVKASEGEQR